MKKVIAERKPKGCSHTAAQCVVRSRAFTLWTKVESLSLNCIAFLLAISSTLGFNPAFSATAIPKLASATPGSNL